LIDLCKYVLFFLINISLVNSQEFKNGISFTVDNDKIALLDRYYTNGLFLSYAHALENDFLFFKAENAKLQMEFTLLQQIYTPLNLSSSNVLDFDRPYAGWLGLLTQVRRIKQKEIIITGLEIGVAGEQSGAGKLQTWWHAKNGMEVPTWEQELGNKFLANLILGLKTISGAIGGDIIFGKFNDFKNSSRTGVVNMTPNREIYFIMGVNYKYVFHNTLIQGDLNYNDNLYTTPIVNNIGSFKTGLYYKNKGHLLAFEYHTSSKETPLALKQIYGSFKYGYFF